ncbi:MAG: hypothetical protein JNK82_41120 [Myxococcaceae bacterium]|nr:hypothetical protein [Myxococcaceae bacterium]
MPRVALIFVLFFSFIAHAQSELGLDLSAESTVKEVVLIPPIYRVTTKEGGAFAGVDTNKVTEKLDSVAHKRLVAALEKILGPKKVITSDVTAAAITKEGLKPAQLRTSQGMAQLAKATSAAWVVYYDLKGGTLASAIYTMFGEATGKSAQASGVQAGSLTPAAAEALQKQIAAHLVALTKAKPETQAKVEPVPAPPPPAEEEVSGEIDSEIARERAARRTIVETVEPTKPRVVLAVGAGATWRNQTVGGDAAPSLAELKNDSAPGIALYAQVNPLHFIERFRDVPYSDLFVDVNWRYAFIRARASGGGVDGQSCSVVDDEIQLRGNFRWALGGGRAPEEYSMLPSIGVGAGWAQERAVFTGCNLPVVSAVYRGVDLQLRVKQPVFRDRVALDLAFGPRVLVGGPLAPKTGLSLAGEAWLEAKPVSLLFLRGGARFFRAVMTDDVAVATQDVRLFFALEVGVHL